MPRGLAAPEMTATLLASSIVFPPFFCRDLVWRRRWYATSEKFAPTGELGSSLLNAPLSAAFGAPRR
jgi:hypothetical protein